MNLRIKAAVLLLCLCWLGGVMPAAATNSDTAKEQRWADQIVDQLIDGEAVWLDDGADYKFLSIYTEPAETIVEQQAMIIAHGIGVHPDWPETIHPLRTILPEHGWSTLSIQMPILENQAGWVHYKPLFDEVPDRIGAAVKYLRGRGYTSIILVGHSLGAGMSSYYMAETPDTPVKAFIGVGMSAGTGTSKLDTMQSLSRIKKPVLDLYGSNDLPVILNSFKLRSIAAERAGNDNFTQIKVKGADHFFEGREEELLGVIIEWANGLKQEGLL